MSHFSYSTLAGGTGETQVNVSVSTSNSTHYYREETYTITDAQGRTAVANIHQRYEPWIQKSTSSFPVIGGTMYLTAHTDYDIDFFNVPDWITIRFNNEIVQEGTSIEAGDANNGVFTIYADANTGSTTRTTGSFCMRHYMNGSIRPNSAVISATQNSTQASISIPWELSYDTYTEEGSITLEVWRNNQMIDTWTVQIGPNSAVETGTLAENMLSVGDTVTLEAYVESFTGSFVTGRMAYTGQDIGPTQLEVDDYLATTEQVTGETTWTLEFWSQL